MSNISNERLEKIISAADEVISAVAGINDDVHPDDSTKMCGLWDDLNDRHAPPEVVKSVARELLAYRKASREPVAWTDAEELRDVERSGCGYLFKANPITPHADERRVIKLYAAPPQAAHYDQHCTCPSGDGSLRWPCPVHPDAQAKGGEPKK